MFREDGNVATPDAADPRLILGPDGFRDSQSRLEILRVMDAAASARFPLFHPFEEPKWRSFLSLRSRPLTLSNNDTISRSEYFTK